MSSLNNESKTQHITSGTVLVGATSEQVFQSTNNPNSFLLTPALNTIHEDEILLDKVDGFMDSELDNFDIKSISDDPILAQTILIRAKNVETIANLSNMVLDLVTIIEPHTKNCARQSPQDVQTRQDIMVNLLKLNHPLSYLKPLDTDTLSEATEIQKNTQHWALYLNKQEIHDLFHPEYVEQIRELVSHKDQDLKEQYERLEYLEAEAAAEKEKNCGTEIMLDQARDKILYLSQDQKLSQTMISEYQTLINEQHEQIEALSRALAARDAQDLKDKAQESSKLDAATSPQPDESSTDTEFMKADKDMENIDKELSNMHHKLQSLELFAEQESKSLDEYNKMQEVYDSQLHSYQEQVSYLKQHNDELNIKLGNLREEQRNLFTQQQSLFAQIEALKQDRNSKIKFNQYTDLDSGEKEIIAPDELSLIRENLNPVPYRQTKHLIRTNQHTEQASKMLDQIKSLADISSTDYHSNQEEIQFSARALIHSDDEDDEEFYEAKQHAFNTAESIETRESISESKINRLETQCRGFYDTSYAIEDRAELQDGKKITASKNISCQTDESLINLVYNDIAKLQITITPKVEANEQKFYM